MKPSEWFDCGTSWVHAFDWRQRQPPSVDSETPVCDAVDPEAAVAEHGLPHALDRLVEGGVGPVGVHEHGEYVGSRREMRREVVFVITLEERGAADRPAPDRLAVDVEHVAPVDSDRDRRSGGLGRQLDPLAEKEPAVLLDRPAAAAQVDAPPARGIDLLLGSPDERRPQRRGHRTSSRPFRSQPSCWTDDRI